MLFIACYANNRLVIINSYMHSPAYKLYYSPYIFPYNMYKTNRIQTTSGKTRCTNNQRCKILLLKLIHTKKKVGPADNWKNLTFCRHYWRNKQQH